MSNQPLIEIRNLNVDYWQQGKWTNVVRGLDLQINPAETFGLVGESGCGKSTTANCLLGFQPSGSRYRESSVWFEGKDLLKLPNAELQRLRGNKISLVPQNPTSALNPAMRVGQQLVETLRAHRYCATSEEARERTLSLFKLVWLPDPDKIFKKYPHQLSGGQQQRVIIAMALACNPKLIILDEPTTGLDVTTQAQVLDLLTDLRSRLGMAMFYVTHNLGVVAQICSRIGVMYAGRLVEIAPKRELFQSPSHPYTQGLIASVPRVSAPSRKQTLLLRGLLQRDVLPPGCQFAPRCEFALPRCFEEPQALADIGPDHSVACWRLKDIPVFSRRLADSVRANAAETATAAIAAGPKLLTVNNLEAAYTFERKNLISKRVPKIVVDEITFGIRPGETYGLVGESGSGKSTIARALNGLMPYMTGTARFDGSHDLTVPLAKRPGELLRSVQLVFQNPDGSLNPRHRVSQIVGRPLEKFFGLSGKELRQRVEMLLGDVHLDTTYWNRFPDELSGGERQRVAIARALASEPKLLLCDEILSALDVSVQANILQLLVDLQAKRGIAFLFISHDLAVVRSLAHTVGVLYWGSLCEVGEVEEVFRPPYHPYTFLLLSSVPEADPDQVMPTVRKDIGLLTEESKMACPFATRCPWKVGKICEEQTPPWRSTSETHKLRCHIPIEELNKRPELAALFVKA